MKIEDLIDKNFTYSEPHTIPRITITPDVGEKLLSINTNNIPPVTSKITLYADLMKKHAWKYNGDSIRVSRNGVLLDGQNRLIAARNARFDLVVDLVVGLDDDVFTTIDQGRVRTKGHLLARELGKSASQSESNTISAAVTKIMKHDKGYSQATSGKGTNIDLLATANDIYSYVENHPELIDQVKYVKDTFGSRALLPQSTILYLYHIGCRFNERYTRKYLEKSLKATMLSDGETLHHLNQALVRIKSKSVKWSRAELENTLIKVWNSIGRSGMYSIRHYGNLKAKQDEAHNTLRQPSSNTVQEMFSGETSF